MLSASITIPDSLDTPGTPISMATYAYNSGFTFQVNAPGASDAVQLYGANIAGATSLGQLTPITNTAIPGAGETSAGPSYTSNQIQFLYLYAIRTSGTTTGKTGVVVGQETPGTSGGSSNPNAILQGGNAFGATINIGPTDGQAMVIGGTFTNSNCTSLTLDTTTTGPVNIGTNANAKTVTIGNLTGASNVVLLGGTGISNFWVATGGQIRVGNSAAAFSNTADSFQVRLGGSGPITMTTASGNIAMVAGGTSTVSITSSSTGSVTLDSGTTGAVNIGNGASAKTVTVGSTTGAAVTTIQAGATGTLNLTGGSSIVMDTVAGGSISIGQSSATRIDMGTAATIFNLGAGGPAATFTIGNSNSTTAVNINSGTGGITISSATTGAVSFDSGTTGTVNLGTGNNAKTVNIATGTAGDTVHIADAAAANIVTIGSLSGAAALTLQSGSGNMLLNAGGSNTCTVTAGTVNIATAASAASVNVGTAGNAAVTTVTIGSTNGTSAVTVACGTGGANFGTSANVHTTTVGGATGASVTTLQAGSGALNIIRAGVTWVWPNALGAAGRKLTDAAGNGVLTFA